MPRIPIEGDIPSTPGAPGPGQGGPPGVRQGGPAGGPGFGPKQRAKRLLRQAAGLQPASDVQPRSGLAPAIEASLNLQLAAGRISQEQFDQAVGGGRPPTSEVAGVATAGVRQPGAPTSVAGSRRAELRARARKVRARRAGLIAGAQATSLGPLGATPGRLPSFADFGADPLRRRTF
jgi:hypothetical protein